MHGARVAVAGGLLQIQEQVEGIERAVDEKPGLAFDLAKTLIESTCRTILTERSIPFEPNDDLPSLFKSVKNHLPFLPPSESTSSDVRKSLAQTLGGLSAAVQGICELRNACGFASHGSEAPRPALEAVQAILAAEAADAIVGFLFRVHHQDRTIPIDARHKYEDNPEFNTYVDELHESVRIFEEDFAPSRILFEIAPEPYRLYLAEYELAPDSDATLEELPSQRPDGGGTVEATLSSGTGEAEE
jgi:hypothetical protein